MYTYIHTYLPTHMPRHTYIPTYTHTHAYAVSKDLIMTFLALLCCRWWALWLTMLVCLTLRQGRWSLWRTERFGVYVVCVPVSVWHVCVHIYAPVHPCEAAAATTLQLLYLGPNTLPPRYIYMYIIVGPNILPPRDIYVYNCGTKYTAP